MDHYNRLHGSMCSAIDEERVAAISKYQEAQKESVLQGASNLVVKINCYKVDVGDDGVEAYKACGFFNGFFYHDQEPYVLTSGHVHEFDGASKYTASLYHSTNLVFECELQLVTTGRDMGKCTSQTGISFRAYMPDVAVFTLNSSFSLPAHPPRPFARTAGLGDAVFVVGYKGDDELELTLVEGCVSHASMQSTTVTALADAGFSISSMGVTAYADVGFSGCPVFDMYGFLVGMVASGVGGCKSKQVVPAEVLETWLKLADLSLPGLKG